LRLSEVSSLCHVNARMECFIKCFHTIRGEK
jgi:hypothetical protein